MRAAVYVRISQDRESDEHGIMAQEGDCRTLARRLGHDVIEVYADNDIGASTRSRKDRPSYRRMLEDCRSGKVQVILAYSNSRLTRRPMELEDLISLHEQHGTVISTAVSGQDDLSTADGRMVARIKASVDAAEVERTSERLSRRHLELAREGKRVGHRAFGWNLDGSLHPEESVLARGMVSDALEGIPLRSIAALLNAQEALTAMGNPWSHQTVRQYLVNPRLVGWRTRHRKVLLDASGKPVQGLWEPLVDVETWEGVNARLRGLRGRSGGMREGAFRYFLSGLCRCGVCGGVMSGNRKSERSHTYRCEGEGHTLSIAGAQLDDMVRRLLILYTSRMRVKESAAPWPGAGELVRVEEKLASTMQAFTRGDLPESIAFAMLSDLEGQRDDMTKDRTRWLDEARGPVLGEITPQHWDGMSVDSQRAVAARLLEAVMVRPSTQGKRFDPGRVAVVWRT